jgi:hypothetical protein
MIITNEKWNDIIVETRAKIDQWNENARKHQKSDVFRIKVDNHQDGLAILCTEHAAEDQRTEHKIVVREITTGEVRRATVVKRRGRVTGFKVWKPDPKAWKSLAEKPAAEIVKQLKLTHFWMFLGASFEGVRSEQVSRA